MMPVCKHFDPIIGVDTHIIQPPGPVPPVPIPHPHLAMIFDPIDYLPGMGATVLINGLPSARAGSISKMLPPHIPLGGTFVKPPSNESSVYMGSSTVLADGAPLAYIGLPAISCQDIGSPAPPRRKGSTPKSLVLPTSVILSIPGASQIMVDGPPIIDMMGTAMNVGGALQKTLKKAAKKNNALDKLARKYKASILGFHRKAERLMAVCLCAKP